jgi:hypothetical protein
MGLVVAEKEKEGEIECIIIIITASHGYTELLPRCTTFSLSLGAGRQGPSGNFSNAKNK